MEQSTRIALIGIVVEDKGAVTALNAVLHEYGDYIFGRMGVPHRQKHVNVISVAIDAPNDVISTLAGKLGMIEDVSVKTIYQKAK